MKDSSAAISVIKIKEKEAFLIQEGELSSYRQYSLNGETLSDALKKSNITISFSDKLEYVSNSKKLIDYRRDGEVLTIEEYDSKPQGYDRDDAEEDVLRAIANKKELTGFIPYYKDPIPEVVEFNIIGCVEDTGSSFIDCAITERRSSEHVLFTLEGGKIAMDEYNILRREYSDHAKFEAPDRNYLRFVKINHNYPFGDSYPFGDYSYRKSFIKLKDAIGTEREIRGLVKKTVKRAVFSEQGTEHKNIQILHQLKTIKKLKTKKSMEELLGVLIDDLTDYKANI